MVRGEGYIQGIDDVKRVALGVDGSGTPISVQDVATVQIGPDIRRGLAELNGDGEVVGGIVVVRYGANAYDVVERVKARLAEVQSGLPEGVEVVPVYDRTALIERSIDTLQRKLLEEMAIVRPRVRHLPAARALRSGRGADPPAGGAHGRPRDVPAGHQRQHHVAGRHRDRHRGDGGRGDRDGRERAPAPGARPGPPAPLADRQPRRHRGRSHAVLRPAGDHRLLRADLHAGGAGGRLFKPLAFTKTYAMAASALLSITLVPVLVGYWIRGRIRPARPIPSRGS